MKHIFIVVTLFVAINGFSQKKNDRNAILEILKNQENAWNNGNLSAFMQGYWQTDSLVFIGKSGVTYGYNQTLKNYEKGYPDTAHMGKFTSTVIKMDPMGSNYYLVIGKWHLQRSMGNISGHYSLIFKRINGKWYIIADHSS